MSQLLGRDGVGKGYSGGDIRCFFGGGPGNGGTPRIGLWIWVTRVMHPKKCLGRFLDEAVVSCIKESLGEVKHHSVSPIVDGCSGMTLPDIDEDVEEVGEME